MAAFHCVALPARGAADLRLALGRGASRSPAAVHELGRRTRRHVRLLRLHGHRPRSVDNPRRLRGARALPRGRAQAAPRPAHPVVRAPARRMRVPSPGGAAPRAGDIGRPRPRQHSQRRRRGGLSRHVAPRLAAPERLRRFRGHGDDRARRARRMHRRQGDPRLLRGALPLGCGFGDNRAVSRGSWLRRGVRSPAGGLPRRAPGEEGRQGAGAARKGAGAARKGARKGRKGRGPPGREGGHTRGEGGGAGRARGGKDRGARRRAGRSAGRHRPARAKARGRRRRVRRGGRAPCRGQGAVHPAVDFASCAAQDFRGRPQRRQRNEPAPRLDAQALRRGRDFELHGAGTRRHEIRDRARPGNAIFVRHEPERQPQGSAPREVHPHRGANPWRRQDRHRGPEPQAGRHLVQGDIRVRGMARREGGASPSLRQARRRQGARRRPRVDAPHARRGRDRAGQVGLPQLAHLRASHDTHPRAAEAHHGRPEVRRVHAIFGDPPPARPRHNRQPQGRLLSPLGRRRDGKAPQALRPGARQEHLRLQPPRDLHADRHVRQRLRGRVRHTEDGPLHRHHHRRGGGPHEPVLEGGDARHLAPDRKGPRGRHTPHPRDPAPRREDHHRHDQGQHPRPRRVQDGVVGRLAHDSRRHRR